MCLNYKWSIKSMFTFVYFSIIFHTTTVVSEKRPFFNIAHMVNSIKEVDYYIREGANAIEADVTFSPNGSAIFTYHGYPCDCFRHCTEREEFDKYLSYIRDITNPSSDIYKSRLILLFLDLKVTPLHHSVKAVAGKDVAYKIAKHVYDDGAVRSNVKILLSIGHIFDYDFVLGFENELESRKLDHLKHFIGWDVGLNDPLNIIEQMWKRIGVVSNIWQGDGRTNCLSPFYNLGRLTAAVKRRDEINAMLPEPYIDKVYHWTIDLTVNLRSSLRTNVDGIITNHPERLINVLKEAEFAKKYRLASHDDDPWEKIRSEDIETPSPVASIMPPIGIRLANGFGDMFNSFTKYVRDFVYLRGPSKAMNTKSLIKARKMTEKLEMMELVINFFRLRTEEKLKNIQTNATHRSL